MDIHLTLGGGDIWLIVVAVVVGKIAWMSLDALGAVARLALGGSGREHP